MADSPWRLPAHPLLEQLQKQAKELLHQYRARDSAALERFRAAGLSHDGALADCMEVFERLAKEVAAAYASGEPMAIREVNWNYGTSFIWDRSRVGRTLPRV